MELSNQTMSGIFRIGSRLDRSLGACLQKQFWHILLLMKSFYLVIIILISGLWTFNSNSSCCADGVEFICVPSDHSTSHENEFSGCRNMAYCSICSPLIALMPSDVNMSAPRAHSDWLTVIEERLKSAGLISQIYRPPI